MALQNRPPIVTILGHVDHGKTSLLDYIRHANVAAREHGGITQHIGAYQAIFNSQLITFIDTPGHAAFEKMRSRGAKVADIAVLVVAIDDGLMPQTIEAIKHIQGARVPMIVAVNKIDLPGINQEGQLQKIKKQLSDSGVLVEEYGGDVPVITLSAKSGVGIDSLLEMILLVAEMNEIKGDPVLPAVGVVIESKLDKFKGPIATILIRNGTLSKGESFIVGGAKGKVRGFLDYNGKPVDEAGPSMPVEVLGLETVPPVGAVIGEIAPEKADKQVASLIDKLRQSDTNVLTVVLKTDNQGSLEAIEDALARFNEQEEHVKVVAAATGEVGEADVKMAASTKAIVIGFNTKIGSTAQKLAEIEHVLIRSYNIIYELIDELQDVVDGMLKIDQLEETLGTAQILAEFPYGKDQKIAGCRILEGYFTKGPKVRIMRGEEVVVETKIKSLKKVREEVNRMDKGGECGMMFEENIDFAVGDLVVSYRVL